MTEGVDRNLAARLAALQRDYLVQLPHRLATIEELWARVVDGDWTGEPAGELHRLVHNLTGSGKTFGVAELSETAGELERQLKSAISAGAAPDSGTRTLMQHSLARLRSVVSGIHAPPAQVSPSLATPAITVPAAAGGRSLFLADGDICSADALAAQLEHYGYRVTRFPALAALEAAVAATPPPAVVVGEQLPDAAGFRAIERLRARGFTGAGVLLGLAGDLAARLGAVRAGAAAFFVKPVEIGELLDRLDALVDPRPAAPFRILIVDDSAALADFHAVALGHAGMIVETVHDPMHALQALEVFAPDLIVMDVYMPGCSGLELAAVIRQQTQYLSIPIVFLSTESDPGRQSFALGLGADDFLTKPIESGLLLRVVQARAERARALRRLTLHDSLTGALNHTATSARLEDEIARAERLASPLSLAVIDVDQFKAVNDTYGHLVGDQVLRGLVRLLRQRLRRTDVVGRMGGEEFAVIMPDTDLRSAHGVIEAMRASFGRVEHEAGGTRLRVAFSGGVAVHVPGSGPAAVIKAADDAMYRAKQLGRNRVLVAS